MPGRMERSKKNRKLSAQVRSEGAFSGRTEEWLLSERAGAERIECSAPCGTCVDCFPGFGDFLMDTCRQLLRFASAVIMITAMNIAAMTGPITKPFTPNTARPPSVEISTR